MGKGCQQVQVDADGIRFTSCSDSEYISLHYHRSSSGTKAKKSCWIITRIDECHSFCDAEINQWIDPQGNLWFISEDAEVILGASTERIAFFDKPVNGGDPWHGYPVTSRRGFGHAKPPQILLDRWLKDGRISSVIYDRIMGGRI